MLKGNSYYNPVLNPERALARRNTVLAQMAKRGKLDEARLDALQKKPLRIDFERQLEAPARRRTLPSRCASWLIAWADRHGYNIYADGLVVRTTLDSRLQAQATQAVRAAATSCRAWPTGLGGRKGWAGSPSWWRPSSANRRPTAPPWPPARRRGALARLPPTRPSSTPCAGQDPGAGGLLAIDPRRPGARLGGQPGLRADPFDHVAQARRQPGSTFKPFVYGAAFDKGMQPGDTLIDQAVEIPCPTARSGAPRRIPPSGKPVSLRDGLVYSRNRITAQLMDEVGPARVARLAKKMGVRQSPWRRCPRWPWAPAR
jgi:penicillin-binding protein 1A